MGLIFVSLVLIVFGISGCATGPSVKAGSPPESRVRSFADVYRQSKQARKAEGEECPLITISPPEGYVKPYTPVIHPPRVIKVWIPAHVLPEDHDVMVAGHWSYVMLDTTRWYIEGEVESGIDER
jgi:hypothetical protein